MANVFTPSGKVIPAAGNVNFNSNASSNAVRQVFGQATSNMQGLSGSNVDHGTRPPPYTALTVPTAASGNLRLSYFRGKSLFLTAPTTRNVGTITTTSVTPTLSGGTGTSFFIAIGTSAGTSNTVGWRPATSGTAITKQVDDTTNVSFTAGTEYFISAYGSNATETTSSLAVSNTSAYGIPNAPASATLTITSLTAWSMVWTAPASGIAPTGYSWSISTSPTVPNTTVGYFGTATTPLSASGSAALAGGSTYYATVRSTRPESISVVRASAGVVSLTAPTGFSITAMTNGTVSFSWTAVSGATGYTLRYGASSVAVGNVSTYNLGTPFNAVYACTIEVTGGPASSARHFAAYNGNTTFTAPVAKSYTIIAVGGDGGTGGGNAATGSGGAGGYVGGTVSLSGGYAVSFGGGGGGAGSFGGGGGAYAQFNTAGAAVSLTAGGGGGGGGVNRDNEGDPSSAGSGGAGGVGSATGSAGADASASVEQCCDNGNFLVDANSSGGGGGTSGSTSGASGIGGGYACGGGGGGGYNGGGGGNGASTYTIAVTGLTARSAAGGGGGSSYRGGSVSSFDPGGRSGGAYILIYG